MNAYNQENITMSDSKPLLVGNVNRYQAQGGDNTYALLIKKYTSDVEDLVIKILRQNKKMSENDANTFAENMFSLGDKRQKDISKEVQACYDEGKTKRQCAHQLVDKYYKITKVNKYQNQTSYQTDREQGGEGEVTEVSESLRDKMTPKSKEEIRQALSNVNSSDRRDKLFKLKDGVLGSDDAFYDFLEKNLDEKEINYLKKRLKSRYQDHIAYDMLYALTDKQVDKVINLILQNNEISNLPQQGKNPTKVERIKKFLGFKKEESVKEGIKDLMTPRKKEEVLNKIINSSKEKIEEIIYDDCIDYFDGDQDKVFHFIRNIVGVRDVNKRIKELYPYEDEEEYIVAYALEVLTKEELIKMFKVMFYGEVNEKVKYEQFKQVAPSLFWNFIDRMKDLNLQFKLDTSYIKGLPNSLNTKGYVLYMETPKVNNTEVEYEFKHSRILSNILGYITDKESDKETSFYIGIDQTAQLHFGFFISGKRYKIGYTVITSYDFQKLIPNILANKDIDLSKLSKKFVSNIESLSAIHTKLTLYLDKYEDDIVIYNAIINNNFGIIIESINDEVVSQQYIEEIIKKYVKISHYSNWYVEKTKSNNKTFYYFILK